MKLAEVEQKAREQREADIKAAAQKEATREMAEQAAREKFRQEIIAWMVQEADLDAQELGAMLSVSDVIGELRLNVPEHQPIIFNIIQSTRQKDGGWRVRNGEFLVGFPLDLFDLSWPIVCRSLGEALIEAGLLFRQAQQEKVESRERKHPMLRRLLNTLGPLFDEAEG